MADGNDLISFIASMTGEGNLRVEENLGDGFVKLRVSEAERRQAKHDIQHVEDIVVEMLRNSRDAGAKSVEENLGDGFVKLRVSEAERRQAKHDIQHVEDIVVEMLRNSRDAGAKSIYVATMKEEGVRTLLFLDDGAGVPDDMRERIFVVEMLRNSRDAGAKSIYVATMKEEGVRTLLFLDDGAGVPDDMRERIFDARVTSKLETMKMDRWGVHGRGMALFSIRQNTLSSQVVASGPNMGTSIRVTADTDALSERADQSTWPQTAKDESGVQNTLSSQVVASGPNMGTSIRVTADTDALSERADQSTWPQTAKDESGVLSCVRGPHNIARTVCEFACEELHDCDVYLGSPTEIAATLYARSLARVDTTRLLFIDSEERLPVVDRLSCAADAADFIRIASGMGIHISERTAHRSLGGSIAPLRSAASRLLREKADSPCGPTVVGQGYRHLRAHGPSHPRRFDRALAERGLSAGEGEGRFSLRAHRGRPHARSPRAQDRQGGPRRFLAQHGA